MENNNFITKGQYKFKIEETHINNIQGGDTILLNDVITTVCNNNIKECKFMGKSIFGDTFKLGYKKVQRVIFFNPLIH